MNKCSNIYSRHCLSVCVGLASASFLALTGHAQDQEVVAPDTFQDCDQCPEMVVMPTGEGTLGVEPFEANTKRGDLPLRKVVLDYRFAIGKTEVTRAEYRTFMDETNHQMATDGCNTWGFNRILGYVKAHTWHSPGIPQNEKHPVVCVSHFDATAYVSWLAEKTGKPYRLPSATEWEYSARAGTRGPWFWGFANADACDYANIGDENFRRNFTYAPVFNCNDGYLHTAPVASFKPNPWGLYDMIGNAWEWTDDCLHRDKSAVPTHGRPWLEEDGGECDRRTPKGGGWVSGTDWARAGAQAADFAVYHSQLLGFRVALELDHSD